MKFSNDIYDALKKFAMIWLPAIGTLYFTVAGIWGLKNSPQVVGSITALDTFLGIILGISSQLYTPANDGHLVVDKTDPVKDVYTLELTTPPEEMAAKGSITLAVKPKV